MWLMMIDIKLMVGGFLWVYTYLMTLYGYI